MSPTVDMKADGRFLAEATDVLGEIHRAFSRVLAVLGVRRPVELQRRLNLDSKLSCYICKVVDDAGALTSGPSIPSREYVRRFVTGATKAGVPAGDVEALTLAYDRFERLVERHAGDRTSFNSLVVAAAGPSDEWLATNLQHRRNMFRGEREMMGVHAQTRLSSTLLERLDDGRCAALSLTGYVGLRLLRRMDRVRVQGVLDYTDRSADEMIGIRHVPLRAGLVGSFLLPDFCTQPIPPMDVERGDRGAYRWTSTTLLQPEVGNLGLSTLMFGERCVYNDVPETLSSMTMLPVEASVLDLLVAPGLLGDAPRLSVFRGSDEAVDWSPADLVPLPGKHTVRWLGRGTGNLMTPDVPKYPEMIRAAARDLHGDIEAFDCWRVRLEYPIYHSTCRLALRSVPADAAPAPDGTR